jgi:predicted transcriptional regulator
MTTITITLSDERLQQLKEIAEHFHVKPEELVRVSVEELLKKPEDDFRRALE